MTHAQEIHEYCRLLSEQRQVFRQALQSIISDLDMAGLHSQADRVRALLPAPAVKRSHGLRGGDRLAEAAYVAAQDVKDRTSELREKILEVMRPGIWYSLRELKKLVLGDAEGAVPPAWSDAMKQLHGQVEHRGWARAVEYRLVAAAQVAS